MIALRNICIHGTYFGNSNSSNVSQAHHCAVQGNKILALPAHTAKQAFSKFHVFHKASDAAVQGNKILVVDRRELFWEIWSRIWP